MGRGAALVTGASRGIGRAVAAALAARGWDVIGTCRAPRALRQEDRVEGVRYLPLDLSSEKSIEELLAEVGSIDLLVNNAGKARSALPRSSRGKSSASTSRSIFSDPSGSPRACCPP